MELKVVNGQVEFYLIAGKDKVKNRMGEAEARELIATGKVEEKNGQIIVNDKFIFGELEKSLNGGFEEEEVTEEVTEEPKDEPKPGEKQKKRARRRSKK